MVSKNTDGDVMVIIVAASETTGWKGRGQLGLQNSRYATGVLRILIRGPSRYRK